METLFKDKLENLPGEEFMQLLENTEEPCISIYMPIHKSGPESQQNPIRLSNLLHQAEEELKAIGMEPLAIEVLLKPAWRLLKNDHFWLQSGEGLAIFLSEDLAHHYHLPVAFDDLVVVGKHFHVKPLLPVLNGGEKFYILALSIGGTRLLEAGRNVLKEVELPEGTPRTLAQALMYDDFEPQKRVYSGTPGWSAGKPGAVFFGHGATPDTAKEEILRYFQQVDKGVREALRGDQAPLVMAGVGYLLPIYRNVSDYPHLMETGVEGSPDEKSAAELWNQARAIVGPVFTRRRNAAADLYAQLAGTGFTSASIEEIVPAAFFGQVASLFVSLDTPKWGVFNEIEGQVTLHDTEQPGDEDMGNLAAIYTLVNQGEVYPVATEEVPGHAYAAAVLRY